MTEDVSLIRRLFEKKMKRRLVSVRRVDGGVNSAAFRLVARTGDVYFAKRYPSYPGDKRDRLGTERSALELCRRARIRCVAEPVVWDPANSLGIFKHLRAKRLASREIRPGHIQRTVRFLSDLQRIRTRGIGDASEACFSQSGYLQNLRSRLTRLSRCRDAQLRRHLRGPLTCAHDKLLRHLELFKGAEDLRPLGRAFKIVSPSDVGFHNILRESGTSERLYFVDFEYFGWDDPAKTMSDLILQPDVPLPERLVPFFLGEFLSTFDNKDRWLARRFRWVCPILWMKWSLIVLNPFLADRRPSSPALRQEQIRRSKRLTERLCGALDSLRVERWLKEAEQSHG